MKAVITMTLVRPTRFKRTVIEKKITAKKDYIVGLVNGFVYERANKENFIPVEKFDVKIFNTRGSVVSNWTYEPTYRFQ